MAGNSRPDFNRNHAGALTLLNVKIYYKAVVNKTAGCWNSIDTRIIRKEQNPETMMHFLNWSLTRCSTVFNRGSREVGLHIAHMQ